VHVFETQVSRVIVVSNTQHSNQHVSTSLSQNEVTVPSQKIFICPIKLVIVVPRYAEDVICVS
jgi:hypothetical protein